jgi:hypothetical protein
VRLVDVYLRAMCFRTARPNLRAEVRCLGTDPKRYINAPHLPEAPLPPSGAFAFVRFLSESQQASVRATASSCRGAARTCSRSSRWHGLAPSKACAKFYVSTQHPTRARQSALGKICSESRTARLQTSLFRPWPVKWQAILCSTLVLLIYINLPAM